MKISIVIPLFSCCQTIRELSTRIISTLGMISTDYEIIFINDYSPENDWEIVKDLSLRNARIKGINLSRNFGQHNAITAGLQYATGDWIVVMDGDLQDKPEEILKLYSKATEGYDIVFAQRAVRHDSFIKIFSSHVFYKVFSYLTDTKQDETIGNFGIYNKKVIEAVLSMKDHLRYFPTMAQWVGFNKSKIIVEHLLREKGRSSYSMTKLMKLVLENIIAFSDKPLRIVVRMGFTITLITSILGFYYLYRYLNHTISQPGYTSIVLSIWFLSGIIICILGIIGIYIGKTFEKVKERPLFLIKDTVNLE